MDGRVKTLHPAIFAGLLARRDSPEHMRQIKEAGLKRIDMVVVNLYPFRETVLTKVTISMRSSRTSTSAGRP